jgi:hypothetical protein
MAFLSIVVGIAVASMPTTHAFGPDRLNTWVTFAPFVWLPGVLVPIALFLHLVLWRKLRLRPGSRSDRQLIREARGDRGYQETREKA